MEAGIELLFVALGIAVICGLLLLSVPHSKHQRKGSVDRAFVMTRWRKVQALGSKEETSAMAVIEADKLLDYVLKARGYEGETMGARLKSAASDFSYLDDIWNAHKLRNRLVHESEHESNRHLTKQALAQFQQGLKDLGAM